MSQISIAWGQATQTINMQLQSFNKTPLLTPEKVKSIQDVVSQEIIRLQELRRRMEERQQELNRACSPRLNSTRALWLATIGAGVSSVCGITATYFTLFGENTLTKTTACAFASLAIATNFGATFYVNKIALINQESAQLAALQDKGEEHAVKFKDFLDKLYQTLLLQNSQKQESIDAQITTCIRYYEQLPSTFRSDKGFASTVSSLIRILPSTDPLKKEFETLDTHRLQKIASTARKEEVRVHYLPTSQEDEKDFKKSDIDLGQGEQGGHRTATSSTASLTFDPIPDYTHKIESLKEAVARRFQIRSSIPYFVSEMGCRLDSQKNTPAHTSRKLGELVVQMGASD